jgi:hypothetical protein
MLPGSGDLYLYGVDKSDIRAAYRCRTQHRLHAAGFHQQLSSNAATVAVSGDIHITFISFFSNFPPFFNVNILNLSNFPPIFKYKSF